MSERQADNIIDLLQKIVALSGNWKNTRDIDLSSVDFTNGTNGPIFQLYVGVSGRVVGIDANGDSFDRTLVTGYHPIWFKQITKTNTAATNLAALY